MRLINELRQLPIANRGDIEGIMRVRGLDLAALRWRLRISRNDPVAITIRDAHVARRVSIPPNGDARWMAACIAAPILAQLVTRGWRTTRKLYEEGG